jgi:hypothetical protein
MSNEYSVCICSRFTASSIVPNLAASWSPWDPLYLQQRLSLKQSATTAQSPITNYLQSMMTTCPLPPQKTLRRNESDDYSRLSRSQVKAKLKAHESSKSLTDEHRCELAEHKYFSNSLNCLDTKNF